MKKNTKIILFIVVLAILTIGVGVVISENLRTLDSNPFGLTPDFSDLQESDRQVTYPFTFEELPEYFEAGLFLAGSGYAGQPHNISIWVSHSRPDDIIWLASAEYSLTIENENLSEPILSSSFSGLRNTEPFIAGIDSWTSPSDNGTYDFILSLTKLEWTKLPEYTITATVGTPGGLMVSGETTVLYGSPQVFTVLEGYPQGFTITPDTGYSIEDIIVDGIIIMGFDPEVGHLFENVTADHTIEATFVKEYIITASAGSGGTISPEGTFVVTEGNDQQFHITADSGYVIYDVLVDGSSVGNVSSHLIPSVTADHTISATFSELLAEIGNYAYDEMPTFGVLDDGGNALFDGETSNSYSPGADVNFVCDIIVTTDTVYSIEYHLKAERVGGGDVYNIEAPKTIEGVWDAGNPIHISDTFSAPAYGEWSITLWVTNVAINPP